MKKIRNSRKGFTLTEIVLVVAIIVILSSVSLVGIAVTISNAQNNQAKLATHNDTFENIAWVEVKNLTFWKNDTGKAPDYSPEIQKAIDKTCKEQLAELLEIYNEEDIIIEYDESGKYITSVTVRDNAQPKTTTNNPVDPNPKDPDPKDPPTDPVVPDPVVPDPVVPDPVVPDPVVSDPIPQSGSLKVGDYTKDNTYLVTDKSGSTYNLQKATNSGDTVEFSLSDNGDGTYKLTLIGGNKWILDHNSGELFNKNGVYFWNGESSYDLNDTCTSYFRDTLGITPD